MSEMNNKDDVIVQYKDDSKFKKRQNFHDKYSTNKYGFRNWMFDKYKIFDGCKILELGCGNGIIWDEKYEELPPNIELVISDFSEGMCNIVKQKHQEQYSSRRSQGCGRELTGTEPKGTITKPKDLAILTAERQLPP